MISLSEILHTIAQALMIPCLIILIILMAGAVWQIGDIVVEYIAERRKHLVLQRYVLKVVVTGLAAQFGRLERKTSAAQQLGHAFLPTCFLALFAVAFVLVVGRFRIGRDHTFVVAEYHAVRSLRDDIVRHDRNLAMFLVRYSLGMGTGRYVVCICAG